MYKNKFGGRNNIAGLNIKKYRLNKNPKWSQNLLAVKLEVNGLSVNKNKIQRIESGEGFITDIELKAISQVLGVPVEKLLDESVYEGQQNGRDKKSVYPDEVPGYGARAIAEKED